jgi:hypothetical protein
MDFFNHFLLPFAYRRWATAKEGDGKGGAEGAAGKDHMSSAGVGEVVDRQDWHNGDGKCALSIIIISPNTPPPFFTLLLCFEDFWSRLMDWLVFFMYLLSCSIGQTVAQQNTVSAPQAMPFLPALQRFSQRRQA